MFHLPLGFVHFEVSKSRNPESEFSGLPKLPLSVICSARLHWLRQLSHPHVCRYVDVVRKKPESLFVIVEAYPTSLATVVKPVSDPSWLATRFMECLQALDYLDDCGLVHASLNPRDIMLDPEGRIKIGGFGLHFATHGGCDVDFPITHPVYSAPEVFLLTRTDSNQTNGNKNRDCSVKSALNIRCDMWSLGLIFFEIFYGTSVGNPLLDSINSSSATKSPFATIRMLIEGLRLSYGRDQTLPEFLHMKNLEIPTNEPCRTIHELCKTSLSFNPSLRPSPSAALSRLSREMSIDQVQPRLNTTTAKLGEWFDSIQLSSTQCQPRVKVHQPHQSRAVEFLSTRSDLTEVYHYWRLTGGNLDHVWLESLIQGGSTPTTALPRPRQQQLAHNVLSSRNTNNTTGASLIHSQPPIDRLPHFLAQSKKDTSTDTQVVLELWPSSYQSDLFSYDPRVIFLPSTRLIERIERISPNVLYPMLLNVASREHGNLDQSSINYRQPTTTAGDKHAINHEASLDQFGRHLFDQSLPRDWGIHLASKTTCNMQQQRRHIEDQSVAVKENDVEYQIGRICLFRRLLNGLPVTEERLRFEARRDIPPFLRAQVWAALLGLHEDHDFRTRHDRMLSENALFDDSYSFHSQQGRPLQSVASLPDRGDGVNPAEFGRLDEKAANQIAVDLPRCHAYDALLASPTAQATLRRVLVSTLLMQSESLEYTQGMDSVAAVFVRLCYPDEALAAACLRAFFITKLPSLFAATGFTLGLTAFFDVLVRLFAFHAPRLAVSLADANVPLIGLTTGWIYTLFAHAMPLDRTEVLWDTLIVGPPSLPMFFYIAIFLQLDRHVDLESMDLEKLCTVLSNFPDIDLDKCRCDALRFALVTPTSLTALTGFEMPFNSFSLEGDRRTSQQREAQGEPGSEARKHMSESCAPTSVSLFYERLCTPNAWPVHLEPKQSVSRDRGSSQNPIYPAPTASMTSESNTSVHNNSPLVSLLDPEDALEHLLRPDCLVLDIRANSDYAKGCIPGCVHREPSQLPFLAATDQPTTNTEVVQDSGWEFVDGPSGTRQTPRIVPPFLVQLQSDAAWLRACQARRIAPSLVTAVASKSPGLIIVVGGTDSGPRGQEGSTTSLVLQMAEWLIRHELDRVCVLDGGVPALLNLPHGRDHLICPSPYWSLD